jgi:hypothetical protein
MNRWLYNNLYFVYYILSWVRMSYYMAIGRPTKAINVIKEHFNWKKDGK